MRNLFLIQLRTTLEETKDITSMLDGLFKSKSHEYSNLRLTFGDLEAKVPQMTLRTYSITIESLEEDLVIAIWQEFK